MKLSPVSPRSLSFLPLLCTAVFFLCIGPQGIGAIALKISPNSTTRNTGSEFEADYSSTHLYIDENNGDSIPITIFMTTGTTGVDEADVYTNLNNRAKANLDTNGDGVPDGILPVNGTKVLAGDASNYFEPYQMTAVSGGYQITLYANKTGAYRLTARFHRTADGTLVAGGSNNIFHWYSDFSDGGSEGLNFRDAAFVISPTKARSMVMYEVNALNIDAEAPSPITTANGATTTTDYTHRSTFADLWSNPSRKSTRPWTLSYAQGLGVNWLWVQPIHPIGVQGRVLDPALGGTNTYALGSPYSVKNFFTINPVLSQGYPTNDANDRANATTEYLNFVNAAHAAGINIMLDVPFNHTSFDCELGGTGQSLFGNGGTTAATQFQNVEARFYSYWSGGSADQTNSSNYSLFNYGERASGASSIALAADRFDFGKFVDVHDVYFGRYAALVDDVADTNNYTNEGDWFDTSVGTERADGSGNGHFDSITQNVWKYFAAYVPFWLNQTVTISGTQVAVNGLDGIRADFGQGLPPQCWEYIMNVARCSKWDLVFMAESLDGGNVTYRSGRHFDVLNENVLFDLYNASNTSNYRTLYDARRDRYGQAMVLWDSESHDEAGYTDPYEAVIRYCCSGAIDGVPDIFYGQEIGISGAVPQGSSDPSTTPSGFSLYQVNFGKPIPEFETFNSLAPAWNALGGDASGQAQLYPVYAGVGSARNSSPALQSSNRYYLNQMDGSIQQNIFSVAKYQTQNGLPAQSDVVFAFANLDRNDTQSGTFNVNISLDGTNNLFGILGSRTYNVKNIAADTEYDSNRNNEWVWSTPGVTGSTILANGISVFLNPVPSGTSAWVTAPFEAQYLRLYDITAPAAPATPAGPRIYPYSVGTSATFTWSENDPGGLLPTAYVVTINNNGVITTSTTSTASITVNGSYGALISISVKAVNPNMSSVVGSSSSSSVTVKLLDPNGDEDGDGTTNASKDYAGTNPFDPNTAFKIVSIAKSGSTSAVVTWRSVAQKTYFVQSTTDLTNPASWADIAGSSTTASGTTSSYTVTPVPAPPIFYRVRVQ